MVLDGAGALATASENVHEEEDTNHKYLFFNRAHRRGKIKIKIAENTIRPKPNSTVLVTNTQLSF